MRILLITPLHPILKSSYPLPKYQTQSSWLRTLKKLNHQIEVFGLQKNQSKIINALKLKKIIQQYQPDEIFFSAGLDRSFKLENTIFFCGVPPANLSNTEKSIGQKAKLIVVNDPEHLKQWQKISNNKTINLPFSAVDPSIFKPSKSSKTINFSFIGTLFQNRQLQLTKLVNQNIDLSIWGWIPPKTSLHSDLKPYYRGEAWGKQVIDIYQKSKMALNLVPDHMIDGGNLRTFEIPACQTLEFINKLNPDYYKPQKEVVSFTSPQDLKTKINYYLNHEDKRQALAKAGYLKTINTHTFSHRFKKLLTFL